MSKAKNSGFTAPVIIILTIILGVMVYSTFDPSTSIGRAPAENKVMGWLCMIGAGGFLFACYRDLIFPNMENDKRANWIKIAITAVLIITGLLILAVFHSGPLGTTTNPL